MTDYFSRDATASPFLHPLSTEWGSKVNMLYACLEHAYHGPQILRESSVHGDSVGCPDKELTNLIMGHDYSPSVWFLPLSVESGHSCAVFAPHGFEIKKFQTDLSLLMLLGIMGKFCGRTDFLHGWRYRTELLSGKPTWGNAQGWWHKSAGVIVVSFAIEGAELLANTLMELLEIDKNSILRVDYDYALLDNVFEKASTMIVGEAKRHPR